MLHSPTRDKELELCLALLADGYDIQPGTINGRQLPRIITPLSETMASIEQPIERPPVRFISSTS